MMEVGLVTTHCSKFMALMDLETLLRLSNMVEYKKMIHFLIIYKIQEMLKIPRDVNNGSY